MSDEPPGAEIIAFDPMRPPNLNRRNCSATTRSGKPCRGAAINGGTVCRMHGGAAPQVRRKAAMRLLDLIDPAITTLAQEMENAQFSSDRQRAANSILDRAGVVRVTQTDADMAVQLLVERLRTLRDTGQ